MTKVHTINTDQDPPSHPLPRSSVWGALASAQRAAHSPQGDVLTEDNSHRSILPQIGSSPKRRGEGKKLYRLKPSCARMMDHWLGGYHNFTVDRLAVRHVESILPEAPEIWREQRRFLQRAVTYMACELGLNQFIDFGSGLPTRGNVHEIVQAINPTAKVIYSDISFTCVAQAQAILDSTPNVRYTQCDAANPSELLCAPATSHIFGDDHQVGIGFSGFAHFVSDEGLARGFATLYKWAAEGSCMAIVTISQGVERFPRLKQILAREGTPLFPRSEQEMLKLLGPWRLTEHGIVPGPYWGLPEGTPRLKEVVAETSFSFLVRK